MKAKPYWKKILKEYKRARKRQDEERNPRQKWVEEDKKDEWEEAG